MDIRPSPIAGTWYSGNPDSLAKQLDGFLQIDRPAAAFRRAGRGDRSACGAPLFGRGRRRMRSGLMRGLAPEIVAVVSPMHTLAPDRLVTSGHEAYQTPLGTIPVDTEAVRALNAALEKRSGLRAVSASQRPRAFAGNRAALSPARARRIPFAAGDDPRSA